MMPINFHTITQEDGTRAVAVFDPALNDLVSADETHPNFAAIVEACSDSLNGADVDLARVVELFNIPKTIERKFQRLGERVTVKGNQILFDGDAQEGPIEQQILDFLDAGEDIEPIVNFYERLKNNPLGNVREGLYSWIAGQRASGNFTITPEGKVIGYKAFSVRTPVTRTEYDEVFISSRPARNGDLVNGVEVEKGQYAEHVSGDLVEMPRSIVLNEPSRECGVGLHVGTYGYARDFAKYVFPVLFDPRDIVSLPDSNSSWKLRVCRYEILDGPVDAPFDVPVYSIPSKVDLSFVDVVEDEEPEDDYGLAEGDDIDLSLDETEETTLGGFQVGDRVRQANGVRQDSVGTVTEANGIFVIVDYPQVKNVKYQQYNFDAGYTLHKVEDDLAPEPDYEGKAYQDADVQPGDKVIVNFGTYCDVPGKVVPASESNVPEPDRFVFVDIEDDPAFPFYPAEVTKVEEQKLAVGDRVTDDEGDEGTIVQGRNGLEIEYDEGFGNVSVNQSDVDDPDGLISHVHGKGGATSQAAKGNGRNPAQDEKGKFANGRPGSARDTSTGRFC